MDLPKSIITLTLVIAASFVACYPECFSFHKEIHDQNIVVYFSPNGGATDAIIKELDSSRKEIDIQAYSFSSVPILKAILEAKNRGITIDIILDKCNEYQKYSIARILTKAGVLLMVDHIPHIAHSKIMIIDQSTIITGSFNFTQAAEENNTENLLIIKDEPELVKKYIKNFSDREQVSSFYKGEE